MSATTDGLVVVDKPAGWTSHDVVARLRTLAGTRRVGHSGTLDPLATGVLVCGIGRATRLLGRLADTDKTYEATIRLGGSTTTDDAEGESIPAQAGAGAAVARVLADPGLIDPGIQELTGRISQRPSSVSAIKVDGKRAYARVRAGEDVTLAEREVTVHEFCVLAVKSQEVPEACLDLDVRVSCSTGTYIRALARDLGAKLGTGGHLVALRRTRVGPFGIADAASLDELATSMRVQSLAAVTRAMYLWVELNADDARIASHGGRLPWPAHVQPTETLAVFDPEGAALCLAEFRDGQLAPVVVWTG